MRRFGTGKKLVYNPTVLAQQGMKRLDAWRQNGDPAHLRMARKIATKLDEIALEVRLRRWQPHEYDLIEQESGWVNANSHGLVQSFLSRFSALTGRAGRLKDARHMMAAYDQRPGDPRWFTMVTRTGYLWFEHWPTRSFGARPERAPQRALRPLRLLEPDRLAEGASATSWAAPGRSGTSCTASGARATCRATA